MSKKTIKLTESKLQEIVKDAVKRILNEDSFPNSQEEAEEFDKHASYPVGYIKPKAFDNTYEPYEVWALEYNAIKKDIFARAGYNGYGASDPMDELINKLINDTREESEKSESYIFPIRSIVKLGKYPWDSETIKVIAIDPHDEKIKRNILQILKRDFKVSVDKVIFV